MIKTDIKIIMYGIYMYIRGLFENFLEEVSLFHLRKKDKPLKSHRYVNQERAHQYESF